MGLSTSEQIRWWGLGFGLFILLLWAVGQSLVPFLAGAAIAYLLDPLADRLERQGFSRVLATIAITVLMLLSVIGILIVLIPTLLSQAQSLITALPDIVRQLQTFLGEHVPGAFSSGSTLRDALVATTEGFREQGLALINGLLSSGLAVVDFLLLIVVAPVVAFYLLLDWDHMISTLDGYLPRQHAATIRELAREVDRVLAGFVRGQLLVCAILGTFYAIGLAVIGLQFGLVIGLFAGLISFIPFVGSILGGVLSVGVAFFQFWGDWGAIGAVALVFVVGQAVEGNYLTPKLVGDSVGLHPVWLMFALSAFGALLGFSGLLIAVPVAAVVGVMSRFLLRQYLAGRLFQGSTGRAE